MNFLKKLGDMVKKRASANKTLQLAVEKTQNETFSQPTIENMQNDSHEEVFFDRTLANTLKNMAKNNGFSKTQIKNVVG